MAKILVHRATIKKEIEKVLYKALLLEGKMEYALYEYEVKEHIAYWKEGLRKDKEEFVFIVTENKGDVAMLLITIDDVLYINEKARKKLKELWEKNYEKNINYLLPQMVNDLANGNLSVTGVRFSNF